MSGFLVDLELDEMLTNLELGEATVHAFLMGFELLFKNYPPDILVDGIRTDALT